MARRALLGAVLLLLGALLVIGDLAPAIAGAGRAGGGSADRFGHASLIIPRLVLASTCHQRPERSLALNGRPLGSCARCTGLHFGGALAGLLLLAGASAPRPWGRSLVLVSLAWMAGDVALGALVPPWDHPLLRLASGAAVVVAAALAGAANLRADASKATWTRAASGALAPR